MEKIATRQAYGLALAELGEKFNFIVLDADLSKSTMTDMFKKKFPERFFNCGIAEANMMSIAAGVASTGKAVFASTFAMFAAGRAFEQVRNSICYPQLNVKIGATHAGISVGEDGASHQSIEDIALMRSIPNMTVISPCDAIETMLAVKASLELNGPVYLRLGRLAVPLLFSDKEYDFKIGKGVLLEDGKDLTIISTGLMTHEALKAKELLAKENINARVINIHTIKPIDKDIIIKAAEETSFIITVEEHNIIGGLGSAVCEVLSENRPTKVIRMGINDVFGRSGKASELLEYYGLTASNIVKTVKEHI